MKRRRSINVSPCKQSRHSTVCRLEQPACCGWSRRRIVSEEGVEAKPEPIIPLCLLRLQTAQISQEAYPAAVHSFVSLPHLPVWEEEESGLAQYPTALPTSPHPPLWSMWSHLLRADLYARCISPPFWVTIPTPRCSHFYD